MNRISHTPRPLPMCSLGENHLDYCRKENTTGLLFTSSPSRIYAAVFVTLFPNMSVSGIGYQQSVPLHANASSIFNSHIYPLHAGYKNNIFFLPQAMMIGKHSKVFSTDSFCSIYVLYSFNDKISLCVGPGG